MVDGADRQVRSSSHTVQTVLSGHHVHGRTAAAHSSQRDVVQAGLSQACSCRQKALQEDCTPSNTHMT